MIISASRRTDIPAFYFQWFMNRIRQGYCLVPNPFNPKHVSRVSLKSEDVDIIVFWTRDPKPALPHLTELDSLGYHYYFLYTVMNNPRSIDVKTPPLRTAIRTFQELTDRIGPQKVIWRYDPIVFTTVTDAAFHRKTYQYIAEALRGRTYRSIISTIDLYRKTQKRFCELAAEGIDLQTCERDEYKDLMCALARGARDNGMDIFSCAEKQSLKAYGIRPGKCVDDAYILSTFGLSVTHKKDPSQRNACGCVVSKDIGMYESCVFGCRYCYATTRFEQAKINYENHNPDSPALIARA
jgi:hypothetical protein